MARTSRKKQAQATVQTPDISIRAALYIRLSVEDRKSNTVSIETQILVINRYLEKHPDIFVYDTYIDNGSTGTNFDRPAFQRMLSDIDAGFINCVIVKDLSRLGRNAIDAGYYLEQYFPMRQVRFIAVTDEYDSADPKDIHAGIIIPLKNMVNEAYALDIGRKVKAQQRQAMKDGEYIGSSAVYGYVKAKDNCHQLVVDPEAAAVVKQIFQWASEGVGVNAIVLRLNEAGISSSGKYKHNAGERAASRAGNGIWQTRTVARILRCETYTGDLVQGHTKTIDHRQIKADADNLITVRNTHEPIISRGLFDKVQGILSATSQKHKSKAVKPYSPNLLKGKIFCAHCGGSLSRSRYYTNASGDAYSFHCISNVRVARGSCPGVRIQEHKLMPALTAILQKELEAALGEYSVVLPDELERKEQRQALTDKHSEIQNSITQYRSRVRGLYENFVQEIITSDEYFEFKKQYEGKIAALETETERISQEIARIDGTTRKQADLSRDKDNLDLNPELTAELIDRLIDRVEVTHDKEIKITFRFRNEFQGEED